MKTLIIFISLFSLTVSAACLHITWELSTWTVNYDSYCQQTDDVHEQQQVLMGLQGGLCDNVNDSLTRLDRLESKFTEAEERLSNVEQNLRAAFEMLESQNK